MTIKYGDFTFDPSHGFTGSAGKKTVKGYMRGGYAEGGMRSESTDEAKATRQAQDDAFAPAKQLNKSLKNLSTVRKQTGYNSDMDSDVTQPSNYCYGGKAKYARGGLRKARSDKGFTQSIVNANTGPGAQAMPKIGQPNLADTSSIQNPTPAAPMALSGMKMGGRTKRR